MTRTMVGVLVVSALLVTTGLGGVLLGGTSVAALSGTAAGVGTVCATADRRLTELSGLAAGADTGRWAVSDGNGQIRVYRLGADCAVRGVLASPVKREDVEDLARTTDGTLWLADIGDNGRSRDTIAVIGLSPAAEATVYRMRYPDGPHDAEALLLGPDRTPLVVTKEVFGVAGVYRPERPVGGVPGRETIPLRRVADLDLPASQTDGGPIGAFGRRTITGGATTEDGTVAALRTYTDAWLFGAPDGDLVAALGRPPVRVPLAGEPQGEAIAFDGSGGLLSGSERRNGVVGQLRLVPGAAALVAAQPDSPKSSDGRPGADIQGGWPLPTAASWAYGAVGTLAVLAVAGLWVARRRRHQSRGRH